MCLCEVYAVEQRGALKGLASSVQNQNNKSSHIHSVNYSEQVKRKTAFRSLCVNVFAGQKAKSARKHAKAFTVHIYVYSYVWKSKHSHRAASYDKAAQRDAKLRRLQFLLHCSYFSTFLLFETWDRSGAAVVPLSSAMPLTCIHGIQPPSASHTLCAGVVYCCSLSFSAWLRALANNLSAPFFFSNSYLLFFFTHCGSLHTVFCAALLRCCNR